MKYLQAYKSLSVTKKAVIWYTLCNILQKGISFIVIPIFVRLLTVEEYGNYVTFIAWKDIIIIFATLNLYCGVFTKALVDFDQNRDRYTSSMQALGTIMTLGLFCLYFPFQPFWEDALDMRKVTMLLLFLYYITTPALSFWLVRQRVEYKYTSMVIVTLLASILTPLCSIILFLLTDWRDEAIIEGFLISQIVFGGVFYVYYFIKGKCFYDKRYWIFALKYNIPLVPHYLSLIILGQVDRIMIKDMVGAGKAGIYTLAFQISQAMTVLTSAINASFVPWFYERLKYREFQSVKPVVDKLCLFVGLSVIFVMLISPEIISIIGTSEYKEAMLIMPVTAAGVYLTFCYSFFSSVEFYYSATRFVMWASLSVGLTKVLLNYLTIPVFGYLSVGYTDLTCYILFMISHFVFMNKVCRKNNIKQKIFNNRLIFGSVILIIVAVFVTLLLYKIPFVRYSIITLTCAILLINRNNIVRLIKLS